MNRESESVMEGTSDERQGMSHVRHTLMGPKCLSVGKGHFQRECPHMKCTWTRVLKEPKVKARGLGVFTCFMIPVWLNGQRVEVLLETGHGQILEKGHR